MVVSPFPLAGSSESRSVPDCILYGPQQVPMCCVVLVPMCCVVGAYVLCCVGAYVLCWCLCVGA